MGEQQRRVALVTGAASGIGAAICRCLAGPEAAILVHTRANQAGAQAVVDAVRAAGGLAELALGDLAEPDTAASLISRATDRFGRLDILISNAGFADRTKFAELTDAAMTRSMEAIHGGLFRLARAALPYLIAGSDPRIVAVSSFVAHTFRTDLSVFPASASAKAASEALVRALAIELAPAGVTVNAVIPGVIRKDPGTHAAFTPAQAAAQTGRIPLGRLGLPEDVAAAVAFLVSPGAAYITGQALHVDGGLVIRA
jgi:3-oxoacyl-[acyl-carrier protein] reductase